MMAIACLTLRALMIADGHGDDGDGAEEAGMVKNVLAC